MASDKKNTQTAGSISLSDCPTAVEMVNRKHMVDAKSSLAVVAPAYSTFGVYHKVRRLFRTPS